MSETKVTRTVVVTDPAGVHARTAVAIRETILRGRSQVTLIKDGRPVSGTDVLQIMTLVVEQGQAVTLEAVGPDADAVIGALEPLFAGQFGDGDQKTA
jgi:phosphotransferase system HPr (HPr) family protein